MKRIASLALMVVLAALVPMATAQAISDPAAIDAAVSDAKVEVPYAVSSNNANLIWQPTPEQRATAVSTATAYFAAKDAGRYEDAYAYFSTEQKAMVPFERWQSSSRKLADSAGQAGGRTLVQVTWYNDAKDAPPGVFAAVDYRAEFANMAIYCGFLALAAQADGSFQVIREELNVISKEEIKALAPDVIAQFQAQAGCN